ncbi:MAG: CHAT domain-containing protein [Cyanobacteria bacterium J06560_6]
MSLSNALIQLKTLLRISELEASLGKVSSLVLIPHRDLHRLPLHTLFSLQFTTTYLPSLQVGLTLKQRATNLNPPANFSLLSLADPRGKHTERLESAEVEATLISQHFHHATTLPTSQATTQNVITQLEATDPSASATSGKIFNFSGHAWAERQPKHSALHLQGEDRLTAETICTLDLKDYELVTLSACETAVTGLQTIESDYVGLYQHYAAGDSPALALKKAQTWLRTLTYPELATWLQQQQSRLSEAEHSGPYDALSDRIGDIQSDPSKINSDQPPYADPYYWAAFTVTGYLAGYSS